MYECIKQLLTDELKNLQDESKTTCQEIGKLSGFGRKISELNSVIYEFKELCQSQNEKIEAQNEIIETLKAELVGLRSEFGELKSSGCDSTPTITESNEALKAELVGFRSELSELKFSGLGSAVPITELNSIQGDNNDGFRVVPSPRRLTYANATATVSSHVSLQNRYEALQNYREFEKDKKDKEARSKNFILTNLPEMSTTHVSDKQFVEKLVKDMKVRVTVVSTKRLGSDKERESKNPRKLHIVTETASQSVNFQKCFVKMKKDGLWEESQEMPKQCLVTPDFTVTEQKLLQSLHQECHKLNTQSGKWEWIVWLRNGKIEKKFEIQ